MENDKVEDDDVKKEGDHDFEDANVCCWRL